MKSRLLIISAAIVAFFSTCETDIDITGDYQKTPVVYGLLDISVDTQFVLINRTFLGAGNAFEAALIEDSMLYDNVEAKIIFNNGSAQSVTLTETVRCNKSTFGAFYSPCYTVYYIPSDELWDDWSPSAFNAGQYTDITYTLDILADGEHITADTRISSTRGNTGSGTISFPTPGSNNDVNYVSVFNVGGSTYQAAGLRVKWNQGNNVVKNSIIHEVSIRFNYVEVMTNGDRISKTIEFPFTTKEQAAPNQIETFDVSKTGAVFYQEIAARIIQNPEVSYREIGDIDYILKVAGVDFSTYLNIGDPVSSVGQSRPTFSNVNNGEGVGIFSSRDIIELRKPLYPYFNNMSDADLNEMVNGQFTSGFCFCDATGTSVDLGCNNSNNHCQ
jgi:hypothetical protein